MMLTTGASAAATKRQMMVSCIELPRLPVIDLALFDLGDAWRDQVSVQIDAASSAFGFFYVVGHGIDASVVEPLVESGHRYFAAEDAENRCLRPDTRSAGPIALPDVPGFRGPVLDYMRSLTGLGHKLMAMMARGLRLPDGYFVDRYTGNPCTSFRMLDYPPVENSVPTVELPLTPTFTEPAFLALVKQDGSGGLETKYQDRWYDLPDMPNSFVCVTGEALARLTNRRYVAAEHRVRSSAQEHRVSISFSFGPAADAVLEPIAAPATSLETTGSAASVLAQYTRRHLG
jgi:isopenicillin N synthase-like dioxygenase